jgi:hypothetical protein
MIMQAWVATKGLVEIPSLQAHKVAIEEKTFDWTLLDIIKIDHCLV